jgi:hypothetical protein
MEQNKMSTVRKVVGMARGVLVLDENLQQLQSELEGKNVHVIAVEPGTPDDKIIQTLLPHRVLVTRNLRDFILEAPVYEYGIISLEKLRFINPKTTAQLISRVLSKRALWSKTKPWLLVFSADGKRSTFHYIQE